MALRGRGELMAKVAFIGLGTMGYPMAGHLATKGHEVTVYNRTAARAERWLEEFRGRFAPTPAEAASGQDLVFACVGNDDDLREVTLGPQGAFKSLAKASVFVDHTTASATIARELHAAAQAQRSGFLDAPVSGGQSGAQNGTLSVMCGGTQADYESRKCHSLLCKGLPSYGAARIWAAYQDDQPNLHCRPRSELGGGASFRQTGKARSWCRCGNHQQGRGAILANGEPSQNHERRRIQFRVCGRLDAQRSRALP